MKKGYFFVLSFVFCLLLTSGCTINKNSEPLIKDNNVIPTGNTNKDQSPPINETADCAKIGETPNLIDKSTGKLVPGGKACCAGLKAITGIVDPNNKNVCGYQSGGNSLCAPCGNGKCEAQYGENHCSCQEDCR